MEESREREIGLTEGKREAEAKDLKREVGGREG